MLSMPEFECGSRLDTLISVAGVQTKEIHAIALSHVHVGHIAGLLNKDGGAAFSGARIFMTDVHHTLWLRGTASSPSQKFPNQSGSKYIQYETNAQYLPVLPQAKCNFYKDALFFIF